MKKYIIFLSYLSVLLVSMKTLQAQQSILLGQEARWDKAKGWIFFQPAYSQTTDKGMDFLQKYQQELELSKVDTWQKVKESTDKVGFTHEVLQQFHQGIKIEGAIMSFHRKKQRFETANGKIATNFMLSLPAKLTETQAVNLAKNKQASEIAKLALHSLTMEKPTTTLLLAPINVNLPFEKENMKLMYKVHLRNEKAGLDENYYLDAHTGEFVRKVSNLHQCFGNTADMNVYSTQNIDVENVNDNFRLYDDCRGGGIHTQDYWAGDMWNSGTNWLNTFSNYTTAHWAMANSYDYFWNTHTRSSFDNNSSLIAQYIVTPGYGYANAFWDGSTNEMVIGDGDGVYSNSLSTLDVIGHELTHGVTQYNGTGGLIYSGESGALNESFSDIFGTMVEFYAQGNAGDYDIGEDCWLAGGTPLRIMSNPNAAGMTPQPDTYGGLYWDPSDPHYNSGVQNFWFYLLAEGGNGTNDISNDYCVNGIGKDKAAQIAYRNLTTYLTPNASFTDARNGSIQAAIDLYGFNSNEVAQVTSAWYAVGVGTSYVGNVMLSNYTVSMPEYWTFNNPIILENVYAFPTASFYVSSAQSITVLPTTVLPANSRLFIGNACVGGARLSQTHSSPSPTQQTKLFQKETALQAYPNPFQSSITVNYQLPDNEKVNLALYDLQGAKVKDLLPETWKAAGEYTAEFEIEGVASGIYLLRLQTSNAVKVMKLVKE